MSSIHPPVFTGVLQGLGPTTAQCLGRPHLSWHWGDTAWLNSPGHDQQWCCFYTGSAQWIKTLTACCIDEIEKKRVKRKNIPLALMLWERGGKAALIILAQQELESGLNRDFLRSLTSGSQLQGDEHFLGQCHEGAFDALWALIDMGEAARWKKDRHAWFGLAWQMLPPTTHHKIGKGFGGDRFLEWALENQTQKLIHSNGKLWVEEKTAYLELCHTLV